MQKYKYKLQENYFTIIGKLAPGYAMRKAYTLFHTPMTYQRNEIEKTWLSKARKFSFSFEKYTIAGYRWGKEGNPKILLLHGWTGVATSMYCFIDSLVAQGYEVISYDAIGHGNSSGQLCTLSEWADTLRNLNQYIGKVECIVAHSLAGATVIVASKIGLQTNKIVLIAPFCNPVEIINKWFGERLGIPANVLKKLPEYFWHKQQKGLQKYGKNWHDIFTSDFHVPTLIIHDKKDKEVSIANVNTCAKQWSWATFIETSGLGHRRILYDKTVVYEVTTFIKESSNQAPV